MHPITNIAIKAAREAGDLIIRYYERLDAKQIAEKSAHDFVTEIDKMVEQQVVEMVREAYPDHAFLGEEGGEQDGSEAEYRWIIDPIDGTHNYIHGVPFFCISIGVEHKGVIENGVIYDPLHQELFYATKGDGAYMNSRRTRVSKRIGLSNAMMVAGTPVRRKEFLSLHHSVINKLSGTVIGVRNLGSTALHLAYVACGRIDACWTFGAHPWDIAAGMLLIKESGGMVSDHMGGEEYFKSGSLVAGAPKVFKDLVKVFRGVQKELEIEN